MTTNFNILKDFLDVKTVNYKNSLISTTDEDIFIESVTNPTYGPVTALLTTTTGGLMGSNISTTVPLEIGEVYEITSYMTVKSDTLTQLRVIIWDDTPTELKRHHVDFGLVLTENKRTFIDNWRIMATTTSVSYNVDFIVDTGSVDITQEEWVIIVRKI